MHRSLCLIVRLCNNTYCKIDSEVVLFVCFCIICPTPTPTGWNNRSILFRWFEFSIFIFMVAVVLLFFNHLLLNMCIELKLKLSFKNNNSYKCLDILSKSIGLYLPCFSAWKIIVPLLIIICCYPSMIGDDEDPLSDSETTEALTPDKLANK